MSEENGKGDTGEAVPGQDPGQLAEILEALIFVHRGVLPPKTIQEVLGEEFTAEQIEAGLAALKAGYESRGGAVRLHEVAGGYQLCTREDLAEWVQKLDFYEHHRHLSRPTLETLAIVAYKQPVTRAEIEAIRGVNAERIVRNLLEKKLVRTLGHKDVPGKPMVFGTTKDFLLLFGLNSLADLPPLEQFVDQPPPADGEEGAPPAAPEEHEADAGATTAEEPQPEAGPDEPAAEEPPDPPAA
jgi:segregation and condensation protein B